MFHKATGISRYLAKMTMIPLLVFGIVTTVFSFIWVSSSMEAEVFTELKSLAGSAVEALDFLYPGEYARYTAPDELLITKGDTILNSNYAVIDRLKSRTDVEYTLFFEDMRIITTLTDQNQMRVIGTKAHPTIVSDVLDNQKGTFYSKVDVFGTDYFCYYEPLFNSDGSCIGMLAAAMPASRVSRLIYRAALPILILSVLAIILAFFWSQHKSKEFTRVIRKMEQSFHKISGGMLSNTVPPELLARKDEFGSMSHSVVDMQASLRTLVEQDMLTGLCNRRFGHQKLDKMIENTRGTSRHFSIALGDIDFFKKFNDTYGHDCGDLVLQEVARTLQNHIKDYGYCTRWGGEEFLIVFTKGTYEEHRRLMEALIVRIREHVVEYADWKLSVTMTFGLIDTYSYPDADAMVKAVDKLLYFGKSHGRNRLVTMDEYQEVPEE